MRHEACVYCCMRMPSSVRACVRVCAALDPGNCCVIASSYWNTSVQGVAGAVVIMAVWDKVGVPISQGRRRAARLLVIRMNMFAVNTAHGQRHCSTSSMLCKFPQWRWKRCK